MKYLNCLILLMIVLGCNNTSNNKAVQQETTSIGRIHISIDESFRPVMQEQLKVFASSYRQGIILPEYKTEAECLRDLQQDSTRMIIISRGLTREEDKAYQQRLNYRPQYAELAQDAVAVIVNKSNPDSVFTMQELRDLLSGNSNKKLSVVVDGNSATSTVRFLMDSVLKKKPLGKQVTGAKSSEDLINYVANTSNAIGFVGVSWLTNPINPQQEQVVAKVRMALLECNKNCEKDTYAKPSQQTIMFRQYPLVRGLYYVLKENWSGLGSGFVNFMSYERGQLIFSRSSLVPYKMKFNQRLTNINETE